MVTVATGSPQPDRRVRTLLLAAVAVAWLAGPARGERPAVVVLPPHVAAGGPAVCESGDLFADRLAETLAKSDVRVVNRAELARALAERALAAQPARPVLSYDAMVRIRCDGASASVTLIDLSLGNEMAGLQLGGDWRSDAAVARAAAACAEAICKSARPAGRLKVRVAGAVVTDWAARLEPLRERLLAAIDESLARSPAVRLAHHLEPITASEESLLLMLGMSRLAGGRQFMPQADVTVEFTLRELNGIGKTFEQTPIQIGLRLTRGDRPGAWEKATATPGRWDDGIRTVWSRIASQLAGVRAEVGAKVLDELAARRVQAEAELVKVRAACAKDYLRLPGWHAEWRDWPQYQPAPLAALADMAATACKLDPLNEEAAFFLARFRYLHALRADDLADPRLIPATLRDVLAYLRRFPGPAKASPPEPPCAPIQEAEKGLTLTCETPFRRRTLLLNTVLGSLSWQFEPGREDRNDDGRPFVCVVWSESAAGPTADLVRQVLELALAEPPDRHGVYDNGRFITAIAAGLRQGGMSRRDADAWKRAQFEKASQRLLAGHKADLLSKDGFLWPYCNLWAAAVGWALHDGDKAGVTALTRRFMTTIEPPGPTWAGHTTVIGSQLHYSKDPELDALSRELYAWARGDVRPPTMTRADWEKRRRFTLFDVDWKPVVREDWPTKAVELPTLRIRAEDCMSMTAMTAARGRLYVHVSNWQGEIQRDWLGLVVLDAHGRPAGEDPQVAPVAGAELEAPPSDFAVLDGQICLAVGDKGLAIYDPAAGSFTRHGAAAGLPHLRVNRMFALSDGRLLCVAGQPRLQAVVFTFKPATGEVRLLHRSSTTDKVESPFWSLYGVWRDGTRWAGVSDRGLIDDALAAGPTVRHWPTATPNGWPLPVRSGPLYAPRIRQRGLEWSLGRQVVAGDRRYVVRPHGLYAFGADGRALWSLALPADLVLADKRNRPVPIGTPGDVPGIKNVQALCGDARGPWFSVKAGLLFYDQAKDTWYGPIRAAGRDRVRPPSAFCTADGIWLSDKGLFYIDREQFLRRAREAGRVATTAELRRRQADRIAALPPLTRGKCYIGMRRFDDARESLNEAMADKSAAQEAGVLLAWLRKSKLTGNPVSETSDPTGPGPERPPGG